MRKLAVIGVLLYLIGGVVSGQEAQPPVGYLIDSAEYKFHLDEREVKCLAVFGLTVFPSDKFIQVPILKDGVLPTLSLRLPSRHKSCNSKSSSA